MTTVSDSLPASSPIPHRRSRAYFLLILMLTYTFSCADRVIFSILAPAIKAEMSLTDGQVGLLGGAAFALLYAGAAIPAGWLADRYSRTTIISAALAIWSAFTAACGFTNGFVSLAIARAGVGVGEGGGTGPSYALVNESFPPTSKGRALALFSLAAPIGSAAGLLLGGAITTLGNWRIAFWTIGIAGLLFAPIIKLTLRDPPRPPRPDAERNVTILQCLVYIMRKPSLLLMLAAGACAVGGFSGFTFWTPSLLVRSYHMSVLDASHLFAMDILIGGVIGLWLGGWGADKFGPGNKANYAWVAAAGYAMGVLPLVGLFFHTPIPITFVLLIFPCAAGLLGTAPVISTIQHLVPANMRSTTAGLMSFLNSLFGFGIVMPLLGAISDMTMGKLENNSLLVAIGAAILLNLLAVLFLFFAAPRLKRDWIE